MPAKLQPAQNFVLVGHGTYTPSTAIYSQIDYMLKANGLTNFHVGTIEGYPTFENMLAQLKVAKAKRVTLVPFMFVAGDHAKNDISVDWKEALEKKDIQSMSAWRVWDRYPKYRKYSSTISVSC